MSATPIWSFSFCFWYVVIVLWVASLLTWYWCCHRHCRMVDKVVFVKGAMVPAHRSLCVPLLLHWQMNMWLLNVNRHPLVCVLRWQWMCCWYVRLVQVGKRRRKENEKGILAKRSVKVSSTGAKDDAGGVVYILRWEYLPSISRSLSWGWRRRSRGRRR